MAERQPNIQRPPTICDVAGAAGVPIASACQVLDGHRNTRLASRDRVLQAVAKLGNLPHGAAWALSARLKEVISVVFRRVHRGTSEAALSEDQERQKSLQLTDVVTRRIEVPTQRRGNNLLVGSAVIDGRDAHRQIRTMARKSDGLVVHHSVLESSLLAQPPGKCRLSPWPASPRGART